MRNWLAIAAVGVALAATPAWTQMRGAHFGRGRPAIGRAPVGQRGAFIPHSSPRFSSMAINRRPFLSHGFRPPFFSGHGIRFHHHGHRFFINSFGWPYGYYSYYPWYPLSSDTYDVPSNGYAEQNYQLQQAVNQLSDEVQRLREEQAEQSVPPPSPAQQLPQPQSNAAPTSPTTLVFRDGRTQKVNNYAIAGGSLWVFTEQRARKIPLSELDIPATQKANEEQGVVFHVLPSAR